jgi:hypothetical protein
MNFLENDCSSSYFDSRFMSKRELYKKCEDWVNNSIEIAQTAMRDAQSASNSETKSTAGDKHDTARSMMQLEVEKLAGQLQNSRKLKEALSKIDLKKENLKGEFGALIFTTLNNYFISVSAGRIVLGDAEYYCISPSSPIGRMLSGKTEGEKFVVNSKVVEVLKIE